MARSGRLFMPDAAEIAGQGCDWPSMTTRGAISRGLKGRAPMNSAAQTGLVVHDQQFTASSQPSKVPIMTTTEATLQPSTRTASMVDIGLLILRIGVGATMIQAGLIKVIDFNTTVGFMEQGGWRLPTFAALMVTAAETAGGIGL